MLKKVFALAAFCSFALCSPMMAEETSSNDLTIELQKKPVLNDADALEGKCPCSPRERPKLAACEGECHCEEVEDPENVLTKNEETLAHADHDHDTDADDEDNNENPIIVEVKKLLASCSTGKCPAACGTAPVAQPVQSSEDPADQDDNNDQAKTA